MWEGINGGKVWKRWPRVGRGVGRVRGWEGEGSKVGRGGQRDEMKRGGRRGRSFL